MSSNKTILITGAGSGLGKGLALGLAKQGHKVIAAVHVWEQKTALLEAADQQGLSGQLEIIKLDVTDEAECYAAQDYEVDILVNNAGMGRSGPVAEMPVEIMREVMETNVFSPLEFSQPFIRQMVDRGSGKLVFVSSIAGLMTNPYLGAYNASKHALESIAQSLRDELHEFGVEVATINPGPYETGFNDRMYESFTQWYDGELCFTDSSKIEKVSEELLKNQFDPQEMIAKMVEVVPQFGGQFRTVCPESLIEQCQDYQKHQYSLKSSEIDPSKK